MLDMLHDHNPQEEAAERQERETGRSVRRMGLTLLLSAALLLALNSHQLVTWVNGFEVGPVQDRIVAFSAYWNERMDDAGLTQPSEAAREDVNRAKQVNWDEVKSWIENEQARSRENARALRGFLGEN